MAIYVNGERVVANPGAPERSVRIVAVEDSATGVVTLTISVVDAHDAVVEERTLLRWWSSLADTSPDGADSSIQSVTFLAGGGHDTERHGGEIWTDDTGVWQATLDINLPCTLYFWACIAKIVGPETFDYTQRAELVSVNAEPWDVENGDTVIVQIDGGDEQTITLDGVTDHAATSAELNANFAAVVGATPTGNFDFRLRSDLWTTGTAVVCKGGTAVDPAKLDLPVTP